jgi:hypothetical protein
VGLRLEGTVADLVEEERAVIRHDCRLIPL